jgi:hypothetical protein
MRVRTGLAIVTAVLMLTVALPAWASPPRHYPRGPRGEEPPPGPWLEHGQFRLRMGLFAPRGDSNFWDEDFSVFTGSKSDFNDLAFGGDLLWSLNPYASVMVSLSTYEGRANQFYRPLPGGFVPTTDQGFPLTSVGHSSRLGVTPLTVGFVFYPAGRRSPVIPYLGIGGGLYFWRWTESGQYCDGSVSPCAEFSDEFKSDGVEAGWFAVGGLDFPVRPTWSLFVEGRVHQSTATLSTDVALNGADRLDLSGTEFTAGFAWRF